MVFTIITQNDFYEDDVKTFVYTLLTERGFRKKYRKNATGIKLLSILNRR